jgi:hypothetical protein
MSRSGPLAVFRRLPLFDRRRRGPYTFGGGCEPGQVTRSIATAARGESRVPKQQRGHLDAVAGRPYVRSLHNLRGSH